MNWLDILVLAVTVPCALLGLWKGAIRLTFGLLGAIAGVILAGHYYRPLAAELWPDGAVWTLVASYVLLLLGTVAVASATGWLVARFLHIILLGWADRVAGLLLGAAAGALVCTVAVALLAWAVPTTQDLINESTLARLLLENLGSILGDLPGKLDLVGSLAARL
jgi:membrane protein required for colicin V production